MNTNISDLRDLKLNNDEWDTLAGIFNGCTAPSKDWSMHVDMLVMAGLVKRLNEGLALTTEGVEAATAIDMIFDWEEFAHRPSKTIEEQETVELTPPRKGMTVGSLVRHTTSGGIGLITHHTMWDGEWGAFRVKFNKPVDNVVGDRVVNQLTQIHDRADKFEFAY